MSRDPNPYAPPQHEDAAPVVGPDAAGLEALRREHLNAETNVKTIGALLYLGAAGSAVTGLSALAEDISLGVITLVLGATFGLAGYLLRRLDPRGRLIYTIFVGLLVPLSLIGADSGAEGLAGMFWPALMVALLWTKKARTVMTPHYRDVVIPGTPHIKRKTSIVVIVLGVILVLGLLAVIIAGASN